MTMRFDLRQLGRKGSGTLRDEHVDQTFQPSEFPASVVEDEEYKVVAPVHLVMDVHKDGEAYRVSGTVATRLELECGRCLEAFEVAVQSPFDRLHGIVAPRLGTAMDGNSTDDVQREPFEEAIAKEVLLRGDPAVVDLS